MAELRLLASCLVSCRVLSSDVVALRLEVMALVPLPPPWVMAWLQE